MKIAIVKLSALGDIVHAMASLQFIKAQIADIEIDWVVEQRYAQLLQYNPDLNQVLAINLKQLKTNKTAIFQQIKQLRQYANKHYDLVIDAQGLLKSALTAKLLGPRVAGFDAHSIRETAASWWYDIKISCPYSANTIDRNASVIAQPLGFEISPRQILAKKAFLFFSGTDFQFENYLQTEQKNLVFVIGSTWESRNYPADKFVKIAEALKQNCLVIWGSETERRQAEAMALKSAYIKMMPALDLNALKALIAKADLVVGNDTGPTHMAWALNRPSITIFGPTPVSRVYQTEINVVVKSATIVNPYKLNKQDFSIRDIDEQDIIMKAKALLWPA
ncbi:MAG: lipopolysaccharide heptosyltransferase I [Methylococcaceae bacterium]|jgi:heptosyltransferase-1